MEASGPLFPAGTAFEACSQSAASTGSLQPSDLSGGPSSFLSKQGGVSAGDSSLETGSTSGLGGGASAAPALPPSSVGSFGASVSHGLFGGNFAGLGSAPPVRWDSANSTDFHKSHTIWSTAAPGQLGSSDASGAFQHQQQQQHQQQGLRGVSPGVSSHGMNATNSAFSAGKGSSQYAFAGSMDGGPGQELPPLALPNGLQTASFLQQAQPAMPSVSAPQRLQQSTANGGSAVATPGTSLGSGAAGGLSGAASSMMASPLGLYPLGTAGQLHRCALFLWLDAVL